jgi:hypothetical protein
MGNPDQTQTVGDKMYWYYNCSDGLIQLVLENIARRGDNLLYGDMNDYGGGSVLPIEDGNSTSQNEKELAAYADQRFSEISMEPKVLLSPRAKALNFTFTFTGKNLREYKTLLAEKNWPGVMNLHNQANKYSNKAAIDSAVEDMKKIGFPFFVKIDPASVPKDKLSYLGIPSVDDPDANHEWFGGTTGGVIDWEQHPDGTGVMHFWMPLHREIMVLVADTPYHHEKGSVEEAAREIDDQFRAGYDKLNQKKELGELDKAGFNAQLHELKVQKRNAYLALLNRF